MLCVTGTAVHAHQAQATVAHNPVPVISGEIGTCSVEFVVTDATGTPVYNAKIRVHIAYGFLNLRKLDLEIGTNSDGEARFEGLPNKGKALHFQAAEGDREGRASYNLTQTCGPERAPIVLRER